jgi:hypothetical protein
MFPSNPDLFRNRRYFTVDSKQSNGFKFRQATLALSSRPLSIK